MQSESCFRVTRWNKIGNPFNGILLGICDVLHSLPFWTVSDSMYPCVLQFRVSTI